MQDGKLEGSVKIVGPTGEKLFEGEFKAGEEISWLWVCCRFFEPSTSRKNDRLTSLLVARQAKEIALVSKTSRMATHMMEDFFRRAKFTGMRIVISKLSS